MANECSRHPGVLALKPFWIVEMKLFADINFSSRFARTAKKILVTVFVKAIGRKSAGSSRFDDLASRTTQAVAHSTGSSKSF